MAKTSSAGNLKYYSEKYLLTKLDTKSLYNLIDLIDEKDNRVAIGAYLFYNEPNQLNRWIYKELKEVRDEYELMHQKTKNEYNDLYEYLLKLSIKTHELKDSKKDIAGQINILIQMYDLNVSHICKKHNFNYQVFYRAIIKGEYHKMSLDKLKSCLKAIESDVH